MPVFLRGRRAFCIIPAPPTSPRPLLIRSPRLTCSCLACSCLACSCLACPAAAAACHSYPHFAYFAAAAFGYRSAARTATSPAWSEKPHDPCPFSHPAQGTATARIPFAVLPGAQKSGRNRTEVRPPPKSNQSVAAASPQQVIWLSGKSPFQKVGIRTPGNTRSSPAPKRTVFRYRAALRKVRHQANKATSRRSRTDN